MMGEIDDQLENDVNLLTTKMDDASIASTNNHKNDLHNLLNHTNNQNLLLPWDRFSYWVNAILVVTFDIELGQSLEVIYPNHVKLSEKDKSNICYLSFPDSNSGFLGDTKYNFRIKLDQTHTNSFLMDHHYEEFNKKTFVGLHVDKSYLFGYVFFRQVKNKSLKRGYFQKSVVLLSKFPFISLFNYVLEIIAPEYFENGNVLLETVCHDIDKWPLPNPGESLSLIILGHLIEITLPVKTDKSQVPIVYKKELPGVPVALPSVHEVNLYKCFLPIINHMHLLWELVMLAEPVVVMASLPNLCSETVQCLVSITWPLKYASDYRPFFTIHNTEFQEFASKSNLPPRIIVGVTNPFFTKSLQHWPHIIKINDTKSDLDDSSKSLKKTTNIKIVDSKPAVYTQYKAFLDQDKLILKQLSKGAATNRPSEAQSAILRRHFMELTQSFIIPLERYFTTLLPLQKNISPFKSVPTLKKFDVNDFLKYLDQISPQTTFKVKGDWSGFYKRFFDSINFKYWFEQKKQEVERKLELLHIQSLCDQDIVKWLQGKHEIEIIDQYLRIKQKTSLLEKYDIELTDAYKTKLKYVLITFLNALPDDVKVILNK